MFCQESLQITLVVAIKFSMTISNSSISLISQYLHDVIIKFQTHCFCMKLGVYCCVSRGLITFFSFIFTLFLIIAIIGHLSCFCHYSSVNINKIYNLFTFFQQNKRKTFPFGPSSPILLILTVLFLCTLLLLLLMPPKQGYGQTSTLIQCWYNINIISILCTTFINLY